MINFGMRTVGPLGVRETRLSAPQSSPLAPRRHWPSQRPCSSWRPAWGRHSLSSGMNLLDHRDTSVFSILHPGPENSAWHVWTRQSLCKCRVKWVPSTGSCPSSVTPGLPSAPGGRAQAHTSGLPRSRRPAGAQSPPLAGGVPGLACAWVSPRQSPELTDEYGLVEMEGFSLVLKRAKKNAPRGPLGGCLLGISDSPFSSPFSLVSGFQNLPEPGLEGKQTAEKPVTLHPGPLGTEARWPGLT